MVFAITLKGKNKYTTKWPDLETEVKTWLTDHTNNTVSMSTRSEKIANTHTVSLILLGCDTFFVL
jgi:hypothetical protein